MTQLLFRADAYATTFSATVQATEGARVRLDRTLFYPEAGGQAPDEGVLRWPGGAARVTDVQKGDGGVWHTLNGELPSVGTTVEGELDWRLRYRHMQRHTGEHLLAQALLRVNPAFRVAAVSMRAPHCTLDLEGGPGDADARAAEAILQDVFARDWPVQTFEVAEAELPTFPLRRPAQVGGTVRLVGVKDAEEWWELSACGGTHLRSTAFAAPVVVLHSERVKGGRTRMTFMAGEEAAEFLGEVYRTARAAAQALSVPIGRLEERLGATLQESAALRADTERVRAGWGAALAAASPSQPLQSGASLRFVPVPEGALVTPTLRALVELPRTVGAVVAPDGRCGAASSAPEVHAGQALGAWLAASGGRGGGKADVAQGQTGDAAAFEAAVRTWARQES